MIRLRAAFAIFVIIAASVALFPLQIIGLLFDWKLRRVLPRFWHRVACYMLGIRIRVHGQLERRRPLMLAVNHVSWLDILVLSAVADVVFIAKSEVRSWPVFGWLARLQKTLFIVREDKRKTGSQVSDIAQRMTSGEIVVLFPEGTTSDGNRLLDVKSSLFGAAMAALPQASDAMVWVQPVALAYTGVHGMAMGRYHRPLAAWPGSIALLPHLKEILRLCALDVEVCFGEALPYTAQTRRKDASALIAKRIQIMLSSRLRGRTLVESPFTFT